MAGGFNPNTWPTFQQSMPMVQGASAGEALRRAYLQNQMQQQQNQSRPGLDAAKLAQMQAGTQGQQISNVQAPEMLALKEYMAQVAAKNAEHGRQNISLQYDKLPALFANAAYRVSNIPGVQSAMGEKGDPTGMLQNILSGTTGFADKFAQVSGQPSSDEYSQPSPQQQQDLQQALQKAQQNRPQEQQMQAPNFPALQQYLQEQAQQPSQGGQVGQGEIPQQAQQPIPQAPAQQQQMQPQQVAPQTSGISPEVLMRAQDATRSSQIKKLKTAQQLNQMQFAANLEKLGAPIEKQIPLVGKYFGIRGRAALLNDTKLAEQGKEPPEYHAYQQLSNSFKLYANEFGRSMGDSSSNEQKTAMENLVSPKWVFSNPNLALSTFKGLRRDEARIAKSLSQSLAETQQGLAKQGSKVDQLPQVPSSSKSPPVGSAAPAGTVQMINPIDGKVYHVNSDQVEDAIASAGWSRA